MSEAWFPELERVLSSGKDEYFCPENTGVFGVQLLPRINTARLGSRLLYLINGQELQAPQHVPGYQTCWAWRKALEVSFNLTVITLVRLLSLPFPSWTWGYHGHRNRRTRMQSNFLPLCPPPLQNA